MMFSFRTKKYMRRRRGIHTLLHHIRSWNKGETRYRMAPFVSAVGFFIYAASIYNYVFTQQPASDCQSHDHVMQRSLLSINSTEGNISESHRLPWEKCDFELGSAYPTLWAVHHLWWIIYTFIGLAVVCDDFFVPALEVISDKMKLSEDVAGATFMAAGSSAPELFTSVAGVAQESDVGVGTIVGSAVFNILVIIALTGALAGQVLTIDWRPLLRDIAFYALSIIVFIIVSLDGVIQIWEAVMLLSLYALYIVVMVFNKPLMNLLSSKPCCKPPEEETQETVENGQLALGPRTPELSRGSLQRASFTGGHARRLSVHNAIVHSKTNLEEIRDPHATSQEKRPLNNSTSIDIPKQTTLTVEMNGNLRRASLPSSCARNDCGTIYSAISEAPTSQDEDEGKTEVSVAEPHPNMDDLDEEDEGLTVCPSECCPKIRSTPPVLDTPPTCLRRTAHFLKWILYVLAFPYYFLFTFTIPDCSRPHNKKWYLASFICSVLWIFTISFCMTAMVARFGCIMGIDQYTMGLVLIAVGTSVPDCLSSVLVARDGFGDMAVSNAIGSNVFDIDLGIGLPMLIKSVIRKGAANNLLNAELLSLRAEGLLPVVPHVKFGLILLGILAVIALLLGLAKFRLNRFISVVFIVLYLLFIAYALIQEFHCHSYHC